ncbi:MAG: molybdopterin-dependent oxidoreductase, partial [Chloroflexi bacterium]|nr:molybdopterin-dependent oxidoreductase [Chloroflexota bacterium]
AAGKGTEWVPIRVGTDAVLALAMANILVNELGIYDRMYLKKCTNAPYLVKDDGYYLRDSSTNKPLVWDSREGVAKTFDDATVQDFVIEGTYTVAGVKVQPGFQILKEHLKKFTAEYAAKITTVPQGTIRRLAREFGEAARVGSTIVVDGVEVPYRPAAAIFFRGIQGHVNSLFNCIAVGLLNHLLGTADTAGGCLGFNPVCHGYPETGHPSYTPAPDPDGLMITGSWVVAHKPYPPRAAARPASLDLGEAFPLAMHSPMMCSDTQEEWARKFNVKLQPKVMVNFGANSVMSLGNKDVMADWLKKFEFIVSFDIFLNEMTDFADVVLPDTTYMERLEPSPNFPFIFNHPGGMGMWGWPIRQPLVEPAGERRNFAAVIYEIADRIGIREPMNISLNLRFGLHGKNRLEPDVRYDYDDLTDRVLRETFGDDHDLEWFKEHGVISWPKNPKEVYWRHFTPVRVPIYYEFIKRAGDQIRKVVSEFGAENDVNLEMYSALPDWHPCLSHRETDPAYDFTSFYFRDTIHTNSLTMENPWLDEASQMNPYTYTITINAAVGKKKGLKDGDIVWVESKRGRKVKGKLKLSEGIHPEGLGIAALCGHWSNDQPIAKGKGIFYNELLEIDWGHIDPISHSLDLCVKVKVYKA